MLHELRHSAEERYQKGEERLADCTSEISTLFLEKVAADYFIKNGLMNEEEKKILIQQRKNEFVLNVKTLVEESALLKTLGNPITAESFERLKSCTDEKEFDLLMKRANIMIDGYNSVRKEIHGERQYRYVMGEIVSELLYQDYKKDPVSTLSNYKEFLDKSSKLGEEKILNLLLGDNYSKRIDNFLTSNEKTK